MSDSKTKDEKKKDAAPDGDEEAPLPIPNLKLAQHYFVLSNDKVPDLHKQAVADLIEGIKEDEMAPYLSLLLSTNPTLLTSNTSEPLQPLLESLQSKNKTKLEELDVKLKEAETNDGEMEVSDILRQKAAYYTKIGDKEKCLEALALAKTKTPGLGARIDIVMTIIRVGFFFNDNEIVSTNLPVASALIDEGGDYDRRNRLKVYQGYHLFSIRDFKKGGQLMVEALSTFTASELMPYEEFVELTVIGSMVWMERGEVKEKLINSPEVRQLFPDHPQLEEYTTSLYNVEYSKFFLALAQLEETKLIPSRLLSPHYKFYVREMRIKAYSQLLESYQSLTLESMCRAFGVSSEFMDADLSKLIAAGRLNCTIDQVHGIVETNRKDSKNAQYELVVKQGDLLLNSLSKLSKVIG